MKWQSNLNTTSITKFDADLIVQKSDDIISNECSSYYGLYNPLCPSPNSENRQEILNKTFDKFIYLDNNATHPILPLVRQNMINMMSIIGNGSSDHLAGLRVRSYIEEARQNIATKLGLIGQDDYKRIIFTGSGSESINTIIKGVFFKNKDKNKNIIVTTPYEHKSTLNTIKWLTDNFNVECKFMDINKISTGVNTNADGLISINNITWLDKYKDRILLVTFMAANNEVGVINNYNEICHYIKQTINNDILIHCDMSQLLGKHKYDVDINSFDAVTFTAHKFGGPQGISALYIKNFDIIEPLIHGGNQEFQKRAGTYNAAQIIGMSTAIDLIDNIDIDNMLKLRNYLEVELEKMGGHINCKLTNRLSNTISVTFISSIKSGEDIVKFLSDNNIFISTSSACNSKDKTPSYVLKSIGLSTEESLKTIRISLNKFTTLSELDEFISIMKKII